MAPPRTTRRPLAAARRATVVLAGLAAIALGALPAQAAPGTPAVQPATSADAAALMAARAHELEKVTEAFNAARDQLAAQQAGAQAAQAALEQARAAQAAAQQRVRGIARSAYTGDNGTFQALLTSRSAEDFIGQVSTLQRIGAHQTVVLNQAVAAGKAAGRAQATAAEAVRSARATFTAVAGQQAALQKQINDYQADFDRLSAQEKQAAIAAAAHDAPVDQRASRGEDRAAPVTDSSDSSDTSDTSESAAPAPARAQAPAPAPAPVATPARPVGASSDAAQIAVSTALAQRGKPYVWAAAGPSTFDCSGLTQFAYRAAGMSLPHSSAAQAGMGTPVSRGSLQPGDLVFFYSPVSHVGIYIGNGQMVHAPTSGDVVKIASIDAIGAYAGARRLAG